MPDVDSRLLTWITLLLMAFGIGMMVGRHHTNTAMDMVIDATAGQADALERLRECRTDSLRFYRTYRR